jgi:hypothetical protein
MIFEYPQKRVATPVKTDPYIMVVIPRAISPMPQIEEEYSG